MRKICQGPPDVNGKGYIYTRHQVIVKICDILSNKHSDRKTDRQWAKTKLNFGSIELLKKKTKIRNKEPPVECT